MQKDKEPAKKIAKQRALIQNVFAPTAKELLKSMEYTTLANWIEKEQDLTDLLFNTVRRYSYFYNKV